jgi:hypothetical protein
MKTQAMLAHIEAGSHGFGHAGGLLGLLVMVALIGFVTLVATSAANDRK